MRSFLSPAWAAGAAASSTSRHRAACCPVTRRKSIKGLEFDNARDKPLAEIWLNGQAFQKYRGTDWMKEPCRTCSRREIDFGGCRCQAFALTGDAANTDPACSLSPLHEEWANVAERESHAPPPAFVYRRIGGSTVKSSKAPAAG